MSATQDSVPNHRRAINLFFSMGIPKHSWFFKYKSYNELSLAHLNIEPEFYRLIYREVPIKVFYFGGSANLGILYNLCLSSIIFIRIYIYNIVYIIRFFNMFSLCFGFDLAWLGRLVQT